MDAAFPERGGRRRASTMRRGKKDQMMNLKFVAVLLAGGALCVSAPANAQPAAAAAAVPEPTEPDPSDATADAAIASAPTPDDAQARIELLQQQVEALQASLNALKAQVAPSGKPSFVSSKASWAEGTTIGGKAFVNVSSISQHSDGADSAQNGTQAELKRFYLAVDHRFDDVFSANLTTDFRYNANGTSRDVLVYVKKAFVQAKLAPELFVRIGSADLPWVPFAEDIYGYRFVENVVVDRTKFGTSADWGVHIGGSLAGGAISYAASAINGAGYKSLSRSSNTIDLEGRISARPIQNIVVGIGGYTGKLGKSADNLPATATPHRATRWNALAAYTDSRVRIGAEYFQATNWNNVTTVTSDRSDGWSAFGSFAFSPRIAVFGRYDWVRPNRRTNADLKDRYFNLGLDFKPVKDINIALVYKRDRADNGTISTSNGTIGGSDKGTYNELGVFGQLKF
jgi:hypothetical protein